jgi:hypothetical protein
METMMRGYVGGAFEFLTKPLGEKELRYIWKHASRWRINAANGSDPRWRRSAGAVNGSGEGSSRGVRQQKKRCRTTRKTQFNSLPNLHALFVEAAEVLQGTEGAYVRHNPKRAIKETVHLSICKPIWPFCYCIMPDLFLLALCLGAL